MVDGNKKRHEEITTMDVSIAAHKVINIPELLEAILFELPALDLFVSQGVDKQFKATIERSVKIQRKLFFRIPASGGGGLAMVNPLLLRILRRHFPACQVYVSQDVENKAEAFLDAESIPSMSIPGYEWSNYMHIMLGAFDYDSAPTMPWNSSYIKMLATGSPIRIVVENEFGYSDLISGDLSTPILTLGKTIRFCYLIVQARQERKMDPLVLARYRSKVSWMYKANREEGGVEHM